MSNSKMNKVIDLYEELIMEHGDETLKNIIGSKDFQKKLLAASGKKKLKKTKKPTKPKKHPGNPRNPRDPTKIKNIKIQKPKKHKNPKKSKKPNSLRNNF